ncbi:cytidylate kinase-like family protein [Selenomonas ruminantium]|uniref:cytidylate kinase-like family protein n=1 Tax=Selenomonas ruminantium TaxID=971 RepID=UPI00300F7FD4
MFVLKENTLITITRQYGSGGRAVSEILAKRMNVRRYDRKIVNMAAEKMGQGADIESIVKSSYASPETSKPYFQQGGFGRVADYNRRYIEQAKAILAIAKRGEGAVFLGRCADFVLKDCPNHYSFFIYADDDFREQRAKEEYDEKTVKELNAVDEQRRSYYAYYTGRKWGDPQNYDMMINTSKITLEEAADLICQYVEMRQK